MSNSRLVRFAAAVSAVTLISFMVPVDVGAQEDDPGLTAEGVSESGRFEGVKAPSSRLAQTDPELLARTDSADVAVFIKLDYDAIATYSGGVKGIEATSPATTGDRLTAADVTTSDYAAYAEGQEADFVAELQGSVPEARIGRSFRVVYGGISASIPANRVEDVLAIDGVVAVQKDSLEQLLTDSSNEFIGSPTIWSQLIGGQSTAGAGVLFGGLDTGGWPEHPSFAANPALPAAPTRPDGTAITCDFGDNPLTPAPDVFACNNKLVGGYPFLTTYNNQFPGGEVFPDSARDSNGHGTHTATTSAGGVVASAPILGQNRGPISGIAPGAQVVIYKVCGVEGCFQSDAATAVEQAILDGVDVINFSISGGTSPFTDPVELAFLDAFAAGILVSASSGNEGPGPSTANHLSGWVTSVGASTQLRRWTSTLGLAGAGGSASILGTSIDPVGLTTPTPVVLAQNVPGYTDPTCTSPAAAGIFTGRVIGCRRSPGRLAKSFNVRGAGGVGMVLYNAPGDLFPEMSDTHFVPTIHTQDGASFLAFLAANPGATATISPGVAAPDQGDVMSAFSSRGPAGKFIKPDVTAPGVQILAGNTPVPDDVAGGPPGQLFQSIGGTSMSSPHTAGAALLLKALHPAWTPSQIRSALMTTATTDVVKEDRVTPADPFDMGAGRIDLNVAGAAGLTFDETAANYALLANSDINAVHLNLPSINVPTLPGRIETVRTAKNPTNKRQRYTVEVTEPVDTDIVVKPKNFDLKPGESLDLTITITTHAPTGSQQFGEIRLVPRQGGNNTPPALHLPVAFVPQQGTVSLTSTCVPGSIRLWGQGGQTSECTITAQNNAFEDTTVDLTTSVNNKLRIVGVQGADFNGGKAQLLGEPLAGQEPGTPTIGPGELFGYIPLAAFGVTPIAVGDEDIVNFNVPPFVYAGKTYSRMGVDSNGYIVVGGGTAEDNECCNPLLPHPARPNNVLAPFWTDLDGTGAPGILIETLTDGVDTWIVVEWQVNVFGTTSNRHFQVWTRIVDEASRVGIEDITFAYDPAALPADPAGQPLVVGAENENGSGGDTIVGLPTEDLRVVSSDPVPGASVTYTVVVRGRQLGHGLVTTEMVSAPVPGVTVVTSPVEVTT